jgi:uncharacterized protein (UPF0332 family)
MLPELILSVATNLANNSGGSLADPTGAADYRSAISRAYYAAYNVAEKFLRQMGFAKPKEKYHIVLQQRLLASGDKEFIKIGSDLGDFHSRRVRADYNMDDKTTEVQANALAAVEEARRMIEALQQCPINSNRWKNIQASIQKVKIG